MKTLPYFVSALVVSLLLACGDNPAPPTSGSVDAGTSDVRGDGTLDADADLPDGQVGDTSDADIETDGDTSDSGDTTGPDTRPVQLPLGETLFLDGDDYLPFWGRPDVTPTLQSVPEGSEASVVDGRLTPDIVGEYVLTLGESTARVQVRDDILDEDTFLNFNYTPVFAMAKESEDSLWVVSPPSNAVQRVEMTADGAVARELVPTGSWPTSVAIWGDHTLLVAQTGRDSIGFLDLATRQVVDAIRVGNEPAGIIVDGDFAYVTLSGEDRVARINLIDKSVSGVLDVGHDPRSMAFDEANGRLFVASLLSSNATPLGPLQDIPVPAEEQRDIAIVNTIDFSLAGWTQPVGTIIRGLWLNPEDPRALVVARSHSRNFRARIAADSQPHEHGLTIVDIDLESPTVYEVTSSVNLDEQPTSSGPAASPFTMSLTPDGEGFLVTLSAGRAVLELDPETWEERGRVQVGHDPRGLAFAHGRVFTLSWLDNAVRSFVMGSDDAVAETEVGSDPTPTDVKMGQRIFNDAGFSRHGDFGCNNCHIDGLTDGLVWNLLLDGNVNTLAFRNVGGTGPFLWGGQLPTLFDFSREVLRLVGADATGQEMELLTTYMQSVTAPPNPYTLPGGKFTPEAERGQEIFFSAATAPGGGGCGECHSGPLFTNRRIVDGKTPNTRTDVPSLLGTYDTGPWGREGTWTTLDDMVDYALVYTGATLEPGARDDLVSYVRQLPGDVLYVNSSSPLNGGRNIWVETDMTVTFSAVLAPGAEASFSAWRYVEEEWEAYPGTWVARGRAVSFQPEEPLAESTQYQLRVAPGLEGTLGETLRELLTIEFGTGEVPGTDINGGWELRITSPLDGTIEGAFIQSTGGRVSGVIIESDGLIDVDHVEGFVAGTKLILDPFLVNSEFGQVRVDRTDIDLYDDDNDGRADRGDGVAETAFIDLTIVFSRTWYPTSH
jgi:DNA-binding beta-propeller fold protein YncE